MTIPHREEEQGSTAGPARFGERVLLYALLTSLTALSIDALLPALRVIEEELTAAPALTTQHIVSIFIFGMGFGELLAGPIADAAGRKRALLFGLVVFALGTVVAMTATSMEAIVAGRFLQGLGVSGPKIATRAMIRDQFGGDDMARVMSLMFSIFILVPMIAPALAQGLIALAGWRSLFVAYLLIAAVLASWLFWRQPETLPHPQRLPFQPRMILRNSHRILSSRRVSLLILATGLIFGAQLIYLSSAADLFFDAYGIEGTFPVYFAILASSIGLASFFNARLVRRHGMETMAKFALYGLAASGLMMLMTTLLLQQRLPLALLMVFSFAAFFSIGLLFGNLNAMAMRSLGDVAGLGASLIASGSSIIASMFAAGLGIFYDGSPMVLALGFSLAGSASLLLVKQAQTDDCTRIAAIR
ncbi:multidrug effflux MFS transporter [Rhizobium helianthi]|uniref:Multidrug effflux MFS transporter n=1 Tax=Rhizobium helianthi TaxID=1132695 RepID=A0ABW4M6V2_9HYPH